MLRGAFGGEPHLKTRKTSIRTDRILHITTGVKSQKGIGLPYWAHCTAGFNYFKTNMPRHVQLFHFGSDQDKREWIGAVSIR